MNKIKNFLSKHKKTSIIAASSFLAAAIAIGGTIAFLMSKSTVNNNFTVATVSTHVDEDPFDGTTKSNVQVENTGTMGAFVRVKLVATWLDKDNNTVALPASLADLDCEINSTDWFLKDGTYYCRNMVPANEKSSALINKATVKENSKGAKKGYKFSLNVLAEGIQGTPETAVNQKWNLKVEDGKLTEEAFK